MKQAKDIEELFQEAFKNYEADPGVNAWNSIKSKLPQTEAVSASAQSTAAASASGSSALTTAVVALTITGLAVGAYYFFDNKAASKKEKIKEKTEQSTPQLETGQTTESAANAKLKEEKPETKKVTTQSEAVLDEELTLKNNEGQTVKKENESLSKTKQERQPKDTRTSSATDQTENSSSEIDVEKLLSEIAVEESSVSAEEKQAAIDESTEKENGLNPAKREAVTEIQNNKSGESISNQETKLKTPKIDMPNTFTPNGDGRNDYFLINDTEIDDLEVTIYSRTNRVVAQWKGKYGKWDGNMPDGTPAPEGVYFYQINFFEEGKVFAPARNSVILER